MEQETREELLQEQDDLRALVRNLQQQLSWAHQQNQSLRIRASRLENVLGIEDYQEAA